MPETRIASVRDIFLLGYLGADEYGLVVTDQRSIFYRLRTSKAALGAAVGGILGGVVGAAITTRLVESAESKKEREFWYTAPEQIAADPHTVILPHTSIESLSMKKRRGGFNLRITYRAKDGRERKFAALVAPTDQTIEDNEWQGVSRKETIRRAGERIRVAYEQALPESIRARVEWRI